MEVRTVNDTEAYWVKHIYEWLVNDGLSTNAITYRLRELHAPTKRSQHWNRSSVIEILKNPAYTGKTYAFTFFQSTNRRKPQSEWIEIPDAMPAIITKEMFQAAQRQLELNYRNAKRNTKRQYLLRGHLYCQKCGRAYYGHIDRLIRYYRCPGKNRITSPINRCLNKNWRADKIEALVWEKIEAVLDNQELIFTATEKQHNEANKTGILESELQQVRYQLKNLDRDQKKLPGNAFREFPDSLIISENNKINDKRKSLQAHQAELETQIQASREAIISRTKLETYTQLVRDRLTTLDFDMKRLALDMLNIKVWIDAQSLEVTGTIPVEEADVVTKSF